jgi:predicted HTH transcriptional regulator
MKMAHEQNAVAHRDYASNGSVQVMLFADRLEVWNPGALPPSLTLEKLRHAHGSVPRNPQLAEPLYLTQYIERMGTGTGDMIRRCREVGLPEPQFTVSDGFVTTVWRKAGQVAPLQPESQPESIEQRVLGLLVNEPLSKSAISGALGQKEISGHLNQIIRVLLNDQTLEYTLPDKPNSRLQKYRLTEKGKSLLAALRKGKV